MRAWCERSAVLAADTRVVSKLLMACREYNFPMYGKQDRENMTCLSRPTIRAWKRWRRGVTGGQLQTVLFRKRIRSRQRMMERDLDIMSARYSSGDCNHIQPRSHMEPLTRPHSLCRLWRRLLVEYLFRCVCLGALPYLSYFPTQSTVTVRFGDISTQRSNNVS